MVRFNWKQHRTVHFLLLSFEISHSLLKTFQIYLNFHFSFSIYSLKPQAKGRVKHSAHILFVNLSANRYLSGVNWCIKCLFICCFCAGHGPTRGLSYVTSPLFCCDSVTLRRLTVRCAAAGKMNCDLSCRLHVLLCLALLDSLSSHQRCAGEPISYVNCNLHCVWPDKVALRNEN